MKSDEKNCDDEIMIFLSLCSEEDRKFMQIPQKKRKTEDYARLMTVSLHLGFHSIFLNLLGAAERSNRIDEVTLRLGEIKRDGATAKQWILDFLQNAPNEKLTFLFEEYREKLKNIRDENFDFTKPLS